MELQMSIVMLPSAGCGPGRDPKDVGITLFWNTGNPLIRIQSCRLCSSP